MLHPSFFTPEQLARANELAGDLTLATDNAEADTRARLLRELREATDHYLLTARVFVDGLQMYRATGRLIQAKNAWVAAYGALPEL